MSFSTRSEDYQISQKSRTRKGDGYDFFSQYELTTAKYDAFSAQMTNLVVVVVLVVKSKALYLPSGGDFSRSLMQCRNSLYLKIVRKKSQMFEHSLFKNK